MKIKMSYWRFAFLLLLLILCLVQANAQRINSVQFKLLPGNSKVEVTYSILPVNDETKYTTTLWLSTDGGATFIGPLKGVSGEIGSLKLYPRGKLKCVWEIYKDVDDLVGSIVFQVRLETEKIPVTKIKFMLYQFSPDAPLGCMYGVREQKGYYGKFQTNLRFGLADYKAGVNGISNFTGNGYWVIGEEEKKSTIFLTGGLLKKLIPNLFAYGGLGFGMRNHYWSYTSFNDDDSKDKEGFVKVSDDSYAGLATEAGLIYFVKNKYPISFGVQNINFSYWTFSTGVGIKF